MRALFDPKRQFRAKLLVVALVGLGFSADQWWDERALRERGVRATGTVVAHDACAPRNCPTDGRWVTVRFTDASARPLSAEVLLPELRGLGSEVPISYDRDDPRRVRSADHPRTGEWRGGMLVSSAIAIAVAAWIAVSRRRRVADPHRVRLRRRRGMWTARCECGWDGSAPTGRVIGQRAKAHASDDVRIVVDEPSRAT